LSILTTSFPRDTERVKAIGVWSGSISLASVLGVLLGGLLSEGPGVAMGVLRQPLGLRTRSGWSDPIAR
jgi:MFS family permease